MCPGWQPMRRPLVQERHGVLVAWATIVTGTRSEAVDLVHDALVATFGAGARFRTVSHAEQYVFRVIVLECLTSTELREGQTVSPLVAQGDPSMPHTTVTGVHGDLVHVTRFAGCAPDGDAGPSEVTVDTATGAVTVLPAGPEGASRMVPGPGVTVTG